MRVEFNASRQGIVLFSVRVAIWRTTGGYWLSGGGPAGLVESTRLKRDAQKYPRMVYSQRMRTNIDIDEGLVRKARKLTRLKSKRQIVDKALELLVRSESRKGILRYYGSGIWKGVPKAMRRNRV